MLEAIRARENQVRIIFGLASVWVRRQSPGASSLRG
jgi:hypothetical protein